MSKSNILKKAMSKEYCGKTRFDYLDAEEKPMIYKAMEEYHQSKAKEVSDEEIHVILNSLAEQRATPSFQDGFHQGAKWMKEQLTKKD